MWTPLDEYIATALLKVMNKKKVTASELSLRIGRNSDFISHSLSRSDSNKQKLNIYWCELKLLISLVSGETYTKVT